MKHILLLVRYAYSPSHQYTILGHQHKGDLIFKRLCDR